MSGQSVRAVRGDYCTHDAIVIDFPESDQWECGECGAWFSGPPPHGVNEYHERSAR